MYPTSVGWAFSERERELRLASAGESSEVGDGGLVAMGWLFCACCDEGEVDGFPMSVINS